MLCLLPSLRGFSIVPIVGSLRIGATFLNETGIVTRQMNNPEAAITFRGRYGMHLTKAALIPTREQSYDYGSFHR